MVTAKLRQAQYEYEQNLAAKIKTDNISSFGNMSVPRPKQKQMLVALRSQMNH